MISKPPAEIMVILNRLQSEHSYQRLLQWLDEGVLTDLDEKSCEQNGEELLRNRGGAKLLREFFKLNMESRRMKG